MVLEQYAGENDCTCPKNGKGGVCYVHFLPVRSKRGVEIVSPDHQPGVVIERLLGCWVLCQFVASYYREFESGN